MGVVVVALGLMAGARAAAQEVVDFAANGTEVAARAGGERLSLVAIWQKRSAALEADRFSEAESSWNDFLTAMGFLGVARAEPFALLELHRGIEKLGESDYEEAERCFARAQKLDPELWSVDQVRVIAATRRSLLSAPAALWPLMRAWSMRVSYEESRYFALLNAGLVLAIAFAVSSALIAIGLLIRHGRAFRHDVREFFAGSFSQEFNELLGWAFVMLPILAWLGLFWATLYWLVVLMAYVEGSERVVAFAALAMATASPLLQEQVLSSAVLVVGRPTPALLSASWGMGTVGARLGDLQEETEAAEEIDMRRFLAYALRDAGRTDEALAILEKLKHEEPDNARILLDIGNIYFVLGNDELAIHHYTLATEVDSSYALAYYNISLAYNKQLRLRDADSVKRKAETLDPELLARTTARGGVVVQDDRPTFAELLAFARRRIPPETYASLRAKRASGAILFDPFGIGGLLAVVLAVVAMIVRRDRVARPCSNCGQAYCDLCKSEKEAPSYCAACLHIFIKREGIAPDAREVKTAAIERQRRLARATRVGLALLAPGLSPLSAGKPLVGLVLILMGAIGLGGLLGARTFVEPLQALGLGLTSGATFPLLLMIGSWGIGILEMVRSRREQGAEA